MTHDDLSPDFLEKLKKVTAKRARIVIDHILKHGQITSEELKTVYGYDHPPRAIRDVREHGIPIETFRVTSSEGKRIAAYRFGNPDDIRDNQLKGRKVFPKTLKAQLFKEQNGHCAICHASYEMRYLQIDHRIPYEVSGDSDNEHHIGDYMLLCTSCNRAKSWSCEHCQNGQYDKNSDVCQNCYWANPIDYDHVAMIEERRVALVWRNHEVADFEQLKREAEQANISIHEYIKRFFQKNMIQIKSSVMRCTTFRF